MNPIVFSVRQTVLVNLLFFVCLFAGCASLLSTPVEFFPDINLNSVNITTVWTGASAEEIERLVTQKLEEELATVTDIDEMRSESKADVSDINIDFDEFLDEVGYQAALSDVRAAIDRVTDLPADAEEPLVSEIVSAEAFPAVVIAVVDRLGIGETALREVARDAKTRIARLPGVNKAEMRGGLERELRIQVDHERAALYGITPADVVERIRRQNVNLPAGTLGSGSGEAMVRAQGDFRTLEEILATVVRDDEAVGVVRLREIARLEEGLEKRLFINRFERQPAEMITITKKDDADILELVGTLDAWMASHSAQLPEGIELHKTLDTAAFVSSRMGILRDNLVAGIVLVIAILWFTIGFRNALLTSIAIPFSFLTAAIFFPLLDITINATTLIGLLLVSGMLVDDAIIVLENVYHRVEQGEPVREAVLNGGREVMWPVIAAVTTTCAAFAPLLLVGGTAGKFVSILPKAVVICLLASLFECLVVLPAHYLHWGSRRRAGGEPGHGDRRALRGIGALANAVRDRVERGLGRLRGLYARLLDSMLASPGAAGALLLALLVAATGQALHLPINMFPGEFSNFNVMLETPPDYSLAQTDALVRQIENEIESIRDRGVRRYSSTVGLSVDLNYDRLSGSNLSMSFLEVDEQGGGGRRPEQVLHSVQEHLERWEDENPEGIVELRVAAEQDGPPTGPPVEVLIQGDDWSISRGIAEEMVAFLQRQPGVFDAEHNLKPGPAEVRLQLDPERAARLGLRFEEVAGALRIANDGIIASRFRDPTRGEDVDIRVLVEERQRDTLPDLLSVPLRTPSGDLVALRDVAEIEVTRGVRAYRRYDERRTVSVTAQIDEDATTALEVNRALQARFGDIEQRFPQVDVRYGGEYEEAGKAITSVLLAFPIALFAIYGILAALFRSYLQPFVVIAAIPFGLAGVVLGVWLLGYQVSFVLLYATIGLTGVVVNDSLVMVDFINRSRADGAPLLEALRQSGVRRFRPILLTTLTTVVALLPMALGLQGESRTYGPFSAAISFGLLVAMVGSLLAVPLGYLAIDSLQVRTARWLGGSTAAATDERAGRESGTRDGHPRPAAPHPNPPL